ncbi:dihydrolipoamide dehydrogenase [Nitrosomonas cryotolerans]|uniref:Dihydrolipoyl dehydrogenase n=2 Tax=Nitrosomonas cryotolerans TaxID=44575 RepID=A0A1N6HEI2_9PROT|nr:dihydrolipoamide dehydrogenase [Nitrosomonas cryotolerans]SIO18015.1 dihydrolipoamide dehydrogenase [Nitrosomonas cryotolerans ATCC 49181]
MQTQSIKLNKVAMIQVIEIEIPDIGDFKDIPIIEILVSPGDVVEKEAPLITLETDKATLEIPAPQAGVIKEITVKVGDKVSQGSPILTLETSNQQAEATATLPTTEIQSNSIDTAEDTPLIKPEIAPDLASIKNFPHGDIHAEVVVLGAGPGGYTAAFRAADLGKKVILIERYPSLGGVCLNVGCIPSKALLHVAKVITEAKDAEHQGIVFGKPKITLDKLRAWKESVIGKLTKGLKALAKKRKVEVIQGTGQFSTNHMIQVETPTGTKTVSFDYCIIAAGSSVARIPGFPYDDPRIIDSTGALKLEEIPKRMLIIGGGIIGLEMATVYDALGCKISVVELMEQLIPGADADLIQPLYKRIKKRYEAIYLKTKVTAIEAKKTGLKVTFSGENAPEPQTYDRILMAVGRRPNGHDIGAENIGIHVNERGYIQVDQQLRTNIPHIFGIGDIVGEPMLAHKATHEGKLAAEIIAGHKVVFDARTIPSVAYTDPEIAWMGLTENAAKQQGIDYEKVTFPWAASGRAIAMAREEGMTHLLLDKNTRHILGASIVGVNAGELISETVLALEMGADMEDISLTIHPHPTLSETILFAAEIAEGSITDLYIPKK